MITYAIFDLDDTLLDLKSEIMNMLNSYTGKNLTTDQFSSNSSETLYGVNSETFFKLAKQYKILENAVPHDGVLELFEVLRQQDTKIVVVTARAWHEDSVPITIDWFDKHGIIPDELRIVGLDDCKSDAICDLFNVRLAVDDRPNHVEKFKYISNVDNSFLYEQPWNQGQSHLKYIKSLHDLRSMLESHEV